MCKELEFHPFCIYRQTPEDGYLTASALCPIFSNDHAKNHVRD